MGWLQSLLVPALTSLCVAVMMSPPNDGPDNNETEGGVDVCLKGGNPVLPCLNAGALEFLEEANQRGGVEVVDGLELVQDDGQSPRSIVPIDHDPHDVRSLWDATAMFLERRSIKWDLGLVYPGLTLRVGPSLNGHGVMEFLLDHRKKVDERSMGTGRLILKRTLLPILLGIKLNVVTLVPIIFTVLVILIKKALFISKAALLISGLLGYSQYQFQQQQHQHHTLHHQHLGYGGLGLHQHLPAVVEPIEDTLYKAFNKYRQDVPFVSTRDTRDFVSNKDTRDYVSNKDTRDFAWTERDKKKSMR